MEIVTYYVGSPNAPKTTKPAHIGANVLVIHAGKLLLERRRDCGRWGLIGGGCKRGEELIDCAVRELWEETGIRARREDLLPLRFYDKPDRIAAFIDKSVWKMYMKLYALRLEQEPVVRASAESKELRFFEAADLRKLDIVETHRALVDDYLELIAEG